MEKRPEERNGGIEQAADKSQTATRTVHYPETLPVPPVSPLARSDKSSPLQTPSAATSASGPDDDDGDDSDQYDWSGEEDLLEEEKKFEHQMSGHSTKKKGWGPRR
jgi:hypothetical protein